MILPRTITNRDRSIQTIRNRSYSRHCQN